jgi:hypothetical protein
MGEFTGEHTQLFESLVQCVFAIFGFVDNPPVLEWVEGAMDGTPVDVGTPCKVRCSAWCIQMIEDAERCSRQQFGPLDVRILLGDICEEFERFRVRRDVLLVTFRVLLLWFQGYRKSVSAWRGI